MQLALLLIIRFVVFAEISNANLIDTKEQANIKFEGRAYDVSSGQLKYIERHVGHKRPDNIYLWLETNYFDRDGNKIAKKQSDFKNNLYVPDTYFEDLRLKTKEKSKLDIQTNRLFIENNLNNKTDEGKIAVSANYVSGQGFHNFIVSNFNNLRNAPFEFEFISLPKIQNYRFLIQAQDRLNDVQFSLKLKSLLLRAFVDPILLKYDRHKKSLLSYEGLSNLNDINNKTQNVRIIYNYE